MGMMIVNSDALITVNGPGTLIKNLFYFFVAMTLCNPIISQYLTWLS